MGTRELWIHAVGSAECVSSRIRQYAHACAHAEMLQDHPTALQLSFSAKETTYVYVVLGFINTTNSDTSTSEHSHLATGRCLKLKVGIRVSRGIATCRGRWNEANVG